MNKLQELLATNPIDLDAVSDHLDGLSHEDRLAQTRTVGLRMQRDLFDAADGYKELGLEHFVPEDVPAKQFVIHYGKNSLPAFSHFEKRFARPADGAGEWWGYNESGEFVKSVVGPGWFITRKRSEEHTF